MVGNLQRGRAMIGLVRANDGRVFQVRQGNYVGQNFGVVTNVADGETTLKELFQDGAGDWAERQTNHAAGTEQRNERQQDSTTACHPRGEQASFLAVALPLSVRRRCGRRSGANVIEDVAVAKRRGWPATTMTFAMKEALAAPPTVSRDCHATAPRSFSTSQHHEPTGATGAVTDSTSCAATTSSRHKAGTRRG